MLQLNNENNTDNAIEKSNELEEGLLNIKEKFSALSSDIMRSKDKVFKFFFFIEM